jgi:hypothetical protein
VKSFLIACGVPLLSSTEAVVQPRPVDFAIATALLG